MLLKLNDKEHVSVKCNHLADEHTITISNLNGYLAAREFDSPKETTINEAIDLLKKAAAAAALDGDLAKNINTFTENNKHKN